MSSSCKPACVASEKNAAFLPMVSRSHGGRALFAGRDEPSLGDLLDDPITRRLMASDGVRLDHLMDVISEARSKLVRR